MADGSDEPERSDAKKLNVKDDTKWSHASKGDGQQAAGVRDRARPSGAAGRESAENAVMKAKKAGSEPCSLFPDFPQHASNPDPKGHILALAGSNRVQEDTPKTEDAEAPETSGASGETKSVQVTRASTEQLTSDKNQTSSVSEGSKAPLSTRAKPRTSGENKQASKTKTANSKTKAPGAQGNGRWSTIKKPVINFANLKLFSASQGPRGKMNSEHPGDNRSCEEPVTDRSVSEQPTNALPASQARADAVQPVEAEATQPVLCRDKESKKATAPEDRKSHRQKSKQDISAVSSSSGRYQASEESLAGAAPKAAKKKKKRQPPPTKPAPSNHRESECSETSSSSLEIPKPKKRATKRSRQTVLKTAKIDASKKTRKNGIKRTTVETCRPPRRHHNIPSEDESESSASSSQSPPPKRTRAKECKRSHRSSEQPSASRTRRGDVSTKASKKKANTKKRRKASPSKKASAKTSSRREASCSDTSSESDSEDRKPRRKVKLVKKVKKVKRKKCK